MPHLLSGGMFAISHQRVKIVPFSVSPSRLHRSVWPTTVSSKKSHPFPLFSVGLLVTSVFLVTALYLKRYPAFFFCTQAFGIFASTYINRCCFSSSATRCSIRRVTSRAPFDSFSASQKHDNFPVDVDLDIFLALSESGLRMHILPVCMSMHHSVFFSISKSPPQSPVLRSPIRRSILLFAYVFLDMYVSILPMLQGCLSKCAPVLYTS